MKIKHSVDAGSVRRRLTAFVLTAAVTAAALSMSGQEARAEQADDLITPSVSWSDEYGDYGDYYDYDASPSDVSASDHIAEYPLEEINIEYFRLRMLVPRFEMSFSAADSNKEIHDKLYEQYGIGNLHDVINYSDYYGSSTTYLYNGSSENGGVSMMVMYDENNYTRFIGDTARLSEEEITDICDNSDFLNSPDPVYPRAINGRTFFCQVSESSDAVTYYASTIAGGGQYTVYIDLSSADQMDDNTVDRILESIKVKGTVKERYGSASRTWNIILSVLCGLLTLAVALLGFFIWRFNAFAKAAGSSFSIIGFNLPPKENGSMPGARNRHNDTHR